jgi:hypothetical protein
MKIEKKEDFTDGKRTDCFYIVRTNNDTISVFTPKELRELKEILEKMQISD